MSKLYFFDQKLQRKLKKRSRKFPDELPRSLRFANLNPRLAAFLSQQDKQQRLVGMKQEGLANERTVFDNCEISEDVVGDQTKGSILPDIHGSESLFRRISMLRSLHGGTLEDAAFEFEGEFAQRQFYKEAVVAAPALLLHLAKVLYIFENEHLNMPREVINEMLYNFKDLIKEAQYTKREWQCHENWLIHKQNEDAKNAVNAKLIEEDHFENKENDNDIFVEGEKKKKRKKKSEVDDSDTCNKSNKDEAMMMTCVKSNDFSKTSHISLGHHHSRVISRSEKNRNCLKPDHGSSGDRLRVLSTRSKSDSMSMFSEGYPDGQSIHQPSFLQVINFSMQSKVCEDKGWIIHQNVEEIQIAKQTLVHWAQERLKMSILQAQQQQCRMHELGYDKPLINRYYGDTRRENIMKYTSKKNAKEKGLQSMNKLPHPKIPTMIQDNHPKFYTSLPDGCAVVYYLSGRSAIIISRNGIDKPGIYAIVYADTDEHSMIATFTPYGKACCYHPNGVARFIAMEKTAMLLEIDGKVSQKINWPLPHTKLATPIFIQLNEQISFKCINRNQMVLGFYCQKESVKFQVGHNINSIEPQSQEELGYLVTKELFMSKAAEESVKLTLQPPKKMASFKDGKRVGKKASKPKTSPQTEFITLIRNMEIPEKVHYSIPDEREHSRILRKIKNICDDWMEHYRLAIGITSPHLRNMSIGPRRRTRSTHSAKSVPGCFAPCLKENVDEMKEYNPTFVPEVSISSRVPSAPPIKYGSGQRPISSYSTASKAYSLASSRKRTEDKVRIEVDGQSVHSKPQTPAPSTCPETYAASLSAGISIYASPVAKYSNASVVELNEKKQLLTPLKGCTVVLRNEFFGESISTCKCSRHHIPILTDIEFDCFINKEVTPNQLVVISIISTLYPDLTTRSMLTKLYEHQNKNRTKPCYQSHLDPYRLLIYDVTNAALYTEHNQPMLLRRHNAVPGMFLMYMNGKLVFCDHIFNGYGNTKKDFLKQVINCKREANHGSFLPNDFRFSPSRGPSGCRSPWGGEIGGTGVDFFAGTGLPDLQQTIERINSPSSTIEIAPTGFIKPFERTTSAADFLTYSLSNASVMFPGNEIRPLTHPGHRKNIHTTLIETE
ncbi:uncharacterized protein [Antedon mediterranea]|uniref:uncharacterized protein n=1 Tax=Antedon mediterranea TaxID=105859 RepID=UPI003AF7FAFC